MRSAILLLALSTPCFADDAKSLFARAQSICDKQGVPIVYVAGEPFTFAMQYVSGIDQIEINVNASHWRNPDFSRREGFRNRVFSSDDLDHLIRHEIGHRQVAVHLGAARFSELLRTPVPLSSRRITETVSSYACTNSAEFLAECYAAIWDRRPIPKDVYDVYVSLWRP